MDPIGAVGWGLVLCLGCVARSGPSLVVHDGYGVDGVFGIYVGERMVKGVGLLKMLAESVGYF